jgi:hypothetical protein
MLEELALEIGEALVVPLIRALASGDADEAARAARVVAETKAAKLAIHKARTEGR